MPFLVSKLYLALAELLCALILGVLDQFHKATLIRSETSNFADNALDKDGTLGSSLILEK
jgi:hypothetical protein